MLDVELKSNIQVPDHICLINYTGNSGPMEAKLALLLLEDVYNTTKGRVHVVEFVIDDDSTIRSHYRNINSGGKLPNNIPQHIFSIKVMVSLLSIYLFNSHAFCDVSWCWAKDLNNKCHDVENSEYVIVMNFKNTLAAFVNNVQPVPRHISIK